MAQDFRDDRVRRTDDLALDRKAADERLVEALEQMDVLGFLAGEVEHRPDPPVVVRQMRTRMIEHERQDELLDDPEDREVLMRADLIEDALLERVEAVERRRPGQALRHEVAREVEFLVLAQDVVELPLRTERRSQRRLIVEVVVHSLVPLCSMLQE